MKQWWVYELRAGDWLYIGQTLDPKKRLREHRFAIRHKKHYQQWSRALQEFPTPEDWEMTVVAGPFLTKEEAISEEERLHREHWNYQGRLWDRCGNTSSDDLKEKLREALTGRTFSDEARAQMSASHTGKKHPEETIAKISASLSGEKNPMYGRTGENSPRFGKKHSPETRARMKATNAARRYTKAFFHWLSL